ncbi:MAG: hypothetical protein IJC82_01555 [Firmicutes bacterium]|nr:hypothetical protein [Bacillota bacterium]
MIDEKKIHQACREVVLILGVLPKEYLRKVPREVLWRIMEHQDTEYHPSWERDISADTDANDLDLLKESLALMAALNLEYWETSEEEKARLRAVYDLNDKLNFWKETGKILSFPPKKHD